MKYYAIIVAGGSGHRMQTDIPKQFLLLQNLPVLMHTIKAFSISQYKPEILVVLNINQHNYWRELCLKYNFQIKHTIIEAGSERFNSVLNALNTLNGDGYVAVQDAVRPLSSVNLIDRCFEKAINMGNAIAALTSSDSVRFFQQGQTTALNRNDVYLVQTPQTFKLSILKESYQQNYNTSFTDDASVVESAGYTINLVAGERDNIKITFPSDLEFAEWILHKKAL